LVREPLSFAKEDASSVIKARFKPARLLPEQLPAGRQIAENFNQRPPRWRAVSEIGISHRFRRPFDRVKGHPTSPHFRFEIGGMVLSAFSREHLAFN